MSSWYRQRIEAGRHIDPRTRGMRLIFRNVSDADFSSMPLHQRCAVLLNIARSIAAIEGLPETSIRLAEADSIGTAAATFLDAPESMCQPVIYLDRRFFQPEVEPDVFVGLVLHEMAHLLFTREFYRIAGKTSKQKKLLLNLIEDYRIERLMSESSPAWRTYLERTRRRLVEEDSLEHAVACWRFLEGYDRVMLLLMLFLFTPEVLESRPDLRAWRLSDGLCVFQELEEIFHEEPLSESQVFRAAKEVYLRFDVFKKAEQVSGPNRFTVLIGTDSLSAGDEDGESASTAKQTLWSGWRLAESILNRSLVGQTFPTNMVRMIEAEAKQTGCPEPAPLPFASENDADSRVKVAVEFIEVPSTDQAREAYQKVAIATREVSEELENVFADPTLGRGRSFVAQPAGRLSGPRLHRYAFDSRLFTEDRQSKKKLIPTKIVLLLDASGSMAGVPEQIAMQLGVIMCEAFRKSSNVDLHVFSHSALAENVTIRDHGDKQSTQERLGAFRAQCQSNYDDVALLEIAKRFERDSDKRRVMFVLGDARPYAIEPARKRVSQTAVMMTARMVSRLRTEGWRVIGITTAPGHGELIFGEDRVHFDQLQLVPRKFAKLLLELFGTD